MYQQGRYLRRKDAAATARGKHGAEIRWKRDRERRDALALIDPVHGAPGIRRRIVVIDEEITVREVVIYRGDSVREERRKVREALSPAACAR